MNNAQKIQAGFDIGNIHAAATPVTFDVPVIFDADGEAVAGLTIVGKNSEQYRLANNAVRAEGYKKSARRKTAIDASTDEGAELLVQAIDGNQKRLALAVVTGWYGFTSNGAPVPLDAALLEAAFDKYPTWQEKVTTALENESNFLKL